MKIRLLLGGNVGEMAQITGFGFVFSSEETLWFCPECRQKLVDLGVAARKILGCGDVLVSSLEGKFH